MTRSPEMGQVIRDAVDQGLHTVLTAIPARVQSWDRARQAVTAQVCVKETAYDASGVRHTYEGIVVANVPILYPGGNGVTIVFPLAKGDTGLLLFAHRPLDKWKAGKGNPVDPVFDSRGSDGDCVFLPGLNTLAAPRSTKPTQSGTVYVGQDGGNFQGAGLGQATEDYLGSLGSWLDGLALAVGYLFPRPGVPTLKSDSVKITP